MVNGSAPLAIVLLPINEIGSFLCRGSLTSAVVAHVSSVSLFLNFAYDPYFTFPFRCGKKNSRTP